MKNLPDNFVVIDLETTGVPDEDTKVSELSILEIGAVDASGRRFYRRVAMGRGRKVQGGALRCNGIDPLDLGCGVSLVDAIDELAGWLRAPAESRRWIMGGKNPLFDYSFLAANWPRRVDSVQLGDLISRRCLDLHSIAYAWAFMAGDLDMAADDFSTDDIYSEFALSPEPKPHNALRGALHEMEGFKRLLNAENITDQITFDSLMQAGARENLMIGESTL